MNNKIYVLSSAGCYKIGVTGSAVEKRMSELQTGNPHIIVCEKEFLIGDRSTAYQCEKYLHNMFKDKRLNGEWFILSAEQLDNIDNLVNEYVKSKSNKPCIVKPNKKVNTFSVIPLRKKIEYVELIDEAIYAGDRFFTIEIGNGKIREYVANYFQEINWADKKQDIACTRVRKFQSEADLIASKDIWFVHSRVSCKNIDIAEKWSNAMKRACNGDKIDSSHMQKFFNDMKSEFGTKDGREDRISNKEKEINNG